MIKCNHFYEKIISSKKDEQVSMNSKWKQIPEYLKVNDKEYLLDGVIELQSSAVLNNIGHFVLYS